MKWAHAKNIMIFLLLLLNIILIAINVRLNNQSYRLSNDQENNIKNVLANSNIFLYTTLPKKFEPMRNIEMVKRNVDSDAIIKHFFKQIAEVKKTNDGNKDIYYKDDSEYVEIYRNGMVKYISLLKGSEMNEAKVTLSEDNELIVENLERIENANLSRDEAYQLLKNFIPRVYKGNRFYTARLYNKENEEYTYIYYNTYNNYYLMNDYMKAVISKDRIEVEVWGADATGFVGNSKKIISVDEALYNFMKYNTIEETYITSVELGYYMINDNLNISDKVESEPYYQIVVKYNGNYYINAYTNQIYDQNLIEITN